jgi:type I restriction enzyme S subunit
MGVTAIALADARGSADLPREWTVKTLGEIATVSAGGTPSRTVRAYWDGDIPWVTTSQIDFNTIYEAQQYITELGLQHSAAKMLPPGCLLMALYGQGKTRGKVATLGVAAATNQACAAIVANPGVSSEYLFHFLASRYEVIRSKSNTGNQDNLNGAIVKAIEVVLPPFAEQREIARALTEADRLIATLHIQVSKLHALKRAVMQELLTGRTRLPGFDASWRSSELGDLGTFSKGKGIKRDDVATDGVACIRYGEIYTRYHDYVDVLHSRIPPAVAATALPISQGEILFAASGETAAVIGKCVAYVGEERAYAGGDIIVFSPTGCDPVFLAHLLNYDSVQQQKERLAQGDAVVHISAGNLSRLAFDLPPLPEQQAIASTLTDIDAQITAARRRHRKTIAIKQGITGALLSGRVRLSGVAA